MSRLTPALNSHGRFVVSEPYNQNIKASAIYTCIALRKFDDLVELGEDIYKRYYQPLGLPVSRYQQDVAANVIIVSLMDTAGNVLYVPDSFVVSFPNQGDEAYNHVVVSCSLGPIPKYVDVAFLEQQIAAAASELIGVEPKTFVDSIDMLDAVTPIQHETLEAARLSRIETRVTDRAKVVALTAQNAALQEQINVMKQYLIDNGLLA